MLRIIKRQIREQKEQAARAREAEVAKKRNAEEETRQIREQKEQAARAREAEVAKKRNAEEERNAKKRDFADIDAAFFPGQPVWYKRNQRAKVLSVHVDLSEKSDFYTIQIMPDGGERQTIGEHLESETAWQKRTDDQTPIQFSNGSKVRLKGLVNQAALNGLLAEIVEWIGDKKKYKVLLARSKQRMLVSPVNLTHADAQPPPPSASTKQYATEHVLIEKMDDGFCDGGRAAGAKSGNAWRLHARRPREVIEVQMEKWKDEIRDVQMACIEMTSAREKCKFIARKCSEIFGGLQAMRDVNKSDLDVRKCMDQNRCCVVGLHELKSKHGVCRHRAILFKLLSDSVPGIRSRLVRGEYVSGNGGGAHAWNVVHIENTFLLCDVMHNHVVL